MTIAQPNPPVAPTGAEGGEFIDSPENTPGAEPAPPQAPSAPPDSREDRHARRPDSSGPVAPRWVRATVLRLERDDRLDGAAATMGRAAPLVERGWWGAVLRGEWLGHALHPAATDLPLGCWTSASILDLIGGPTARSAARRLTGVGLLAVPLTALSGLADWSASDDARVGRVGTVHAAGNLVVAGAYLASWRARRADRHRQAVAWGLAGAALSVVTGYLGGHMSFGRAASVEPRGLDSLGAGATPTAATEP